MELVSSGGSIVDFALVLSVLILLRDNVSSEDMDGSGSICFLRRVDCDPCIVEPDRCDVMLASSP